MIATRMHTGFVANGSFELVTDKSGELHHQSTVDGWQAMGSYDDRVMKIVQSAEATEGAGVLALDSSAERLDRLYQDLATEPDRQYYLSFDIKGADEPGMDNELRIRWNGQWAGSFVGTSNWQTYGLLLTADSELTRLVLRETAGGELGKGDGHGPLLDNIRIDKVDQLPQIPTIADAVITQGNDFYLDIAASDPDGTPLTYEITSGGEPVSGGIHQPYISRDGGIFWQPGRDGIVDLTVTATDNFGVPVTQEFSLTVERNADVPPNFEPFSGQRQLSNVKPELRNGLYDQAPQMSIDTAKEYEAIFQTADGQIRVLLNDDQAPITVNNFVNLALDGYYDGLTFHRVVDLGPGFIAQGGDPTGFGAGGPGYQFADEATALGEFDRRDLLAMANAGPNTNGSQFFFTLSPQTQLNGQHAIFGEVIEGSDVVDAINRRVVGSTTPAEQIYSVRILEDGVQLQNQDWEFDIDIWNTSTGTSAMDQFYRSDSKTIQLSNVYHKGNSWNFNEKDGSENFDHVEAYYFSIKNAGENLDLSQFSLGFTFNIGQPMGGNDKPGWLSHYGESIPGTLKAQTTYPFVYFHLSDFQNLKWYGDTQAIKQFTFIPYDQNVNTNFYGKRAVVVSFGPDNITDNTGNKHNYPVDGPGGIAQSSTLSGDQLQTIAASRLKGKADLGWQLTGKKEGINQYEVQGTGLDFSKITNQKLKDGLRLLTYENDWEYAVGSIAHWMLNLSPTQLNATTFHLNIDERIDTNETLLSQSIFVRNKTLSEWTPILLENSNQWAVTSDVDEGVIDGWSRSVLTNPAVVDKQPNKQLTPTQKFENLMLDLQSSFQKDHWADYHKNTPDVFNNPGDRSIAVAGVTFKANPKRNGSGIQLNAYADSYDWTLPGPALTYEDKIATAICNRWGWNVFDPNAKGVIATQFLDGGGDTTCPVWMKDNQMFTFSDGSDGPEVLSPYSYFERNYQMTADDNLKVLSSFSTWNDTTLIQGNTGSAISFASYGYTNGPVAKNSLNKVWVPRITQAKPFDYINGVISNKSCYGTPLVGKGYWFNKNGIFDNTIEKVRVDSWVNQAGLNQNRILDTGVFSALNKNDVFSVDADFAPGGSFTSRDVSFGINKNDFGDLYLNSSLFVGGSGKALLYAFNDNSIVNGGSLPSYSGDNWYFDHNGKSGEAKIPYFANSHDYENVNGFVVTYTNESEDENKNYINVNQSRNTATYHFWD
ncbi:MAG: peptidylprolyl isomerase [Mariniblastus sp.]|nr:peptidylprolyl isomerase [Mariniblastus sp.]